jgi:hypothetical protein
MHESTKKQGMKREKKPSSIFENCSLYAAEN